MAELDIRERQTGDVTILDMKGKVTLGTEASLRASVRQLLEDGRKKLVLNLTSITGADPDGVKALIATHTDAGKANADLRLVVPPGTLREALHITQLITVFDFYNSEGEALAGFR